GRGDVRVDERAGLPGGRRGATPALPRAPDVRGVAAPHRLGGRRRRGSRASGRGLAGGAMKARPPRAPPAFPAPALESGSLFRLDGKVALLAGGYGGLGEHLADALVASGAAVAIAGRSREKAERAAARNDGSSIGVELDVVDRGSVDSAVDRIVEELGRLDIVVNCASVLVEQPAADV